MNNFKDIVAESKDLVTNNTTDIKDTIRQAKESIINSSLQVSDRFTPRVSLEDISNRVMERPTINDISDRIPHRFSGLSEQQPATPIVQEDEWGVSQHEDGSYSYVDPQNRRISGITDGREAVRLKQKADADYRAKQIGAPTAGSLQSGFNALMAGGVELALNKGVASFIGPTALAARVDNHNKLTGDNITQEQINYFQELQTKPVLFPNEREFLNSKEGRLLQDLQKKADKSLDQYTRLREFTNKVKDEYFPVNNRESNAAYAAFKHTAKEEGLMRALYAGLRDDAWEGVKGSLDSIFYTLALSAGVGATQGAAFVAVTRGTAHELTQEFREVNGREPTMDETSSIMAYATMSSLVEKIGGDIVMGAFPMAKALGTKNFTNMVMEGASEAVKNTFKGMFKKLPTEAVKEATKRTVAGTAKNIVGAMASEAGEEAAQSYFEQKAVSDDINTSEIGFSALQGALGTIGTGASLSTGGMSVNLAKQIKENIKINKAYNEYAEAKEYQEKQPLKEKLIKDIDALKQRQEQGVTLSTDDEAKLKDYQAELDNLNRLDKILTPEEIQRREETLKKESPEAYEYYNKRAEISKETTQQELEDDFSEADIDQQIDAIYAKVESPTYKRGDFTEDDLTQLENNIDKIQTENKRKRFKLIEKLIAETTAGKDAQSDDLVDKVNAIIDQYTVSEDNAETPLTSVIGEIVKDDNTEETIKLNKSSEAFNETEKTLLAVGEKTLKYVNQETIKGQSQDYRGIRPLVKEIVNAFNDPNKSNAALKNFLVNKEEQLNRFVNSRISKAKAFNEAIQKSSKEGVYYIVKSAAADNDLVYSVEASNIPYTVDTEKARQQVREGLGEEAEFTWAISGNKKKGKKNTSGKMASSGLVDFINAEAAYGKHALEWLANYKTHSRNPKNIPTVTKQDLKIKAKINKTDEQKKKDQQGIKEAVNKATPKTTETKPTTTTIVDNKETKTDKPIKTEQPAKKEMTIEETSKSIFNIDAEMRVIPVNTEGVMGAGLAKQFKDRFPELATEYAKRKAKIGEVYILGKEYIMFPTKELWKNASKIEYIEKGLVSLRKLLEDNEITSVAIPKLGSGLGKLNWGDVKPKIIKAFKGSNIKLIFTDPDAIKQPVKQEVKQPTIKETSKPQETKADKITLPEHVTFTVSKTSDYPTRTRENASADSTLAIASDFNTAGERLTKNTVKFQKKQYIPVSLNNLNERITKLGRKEAIRDTAKHIAGRLEKNKTKSLNIAGNGIYTLKNKYTQENLDNLVYELISSIHETYPLLSIRTGGQSGIDEAGAKAGIRLGIPTRIHAPNNWMYKNEKGETIYSEAAFKNRFVNAIKQASKPQENKTTEDIKENLDKEVKKWVDDIISKSRVGDSNVLLTSKMGISHKDNEAYFARLFFMEMFDDEYVRANIYSVKTLQTIRKIVEKNKDKITNPINTPKKVLSTYKKIIEQEVQKRSDYRTFLLGTEGVTINEPPIKEFLNVNVGKAWDLVRQDLIQQQRKTKTTEGDQTVGDNTGSSKETPSVEAPKSYSETVSEKDIKKSIKKIEKAVTIDNPIDADVGESNTPATNEESTATTIAEGSVEDTIVTGIKLSENMVNVYSNKEKLDKVLQLEQYFKDKKLYDKFKPLSDFLAKKEIKINEKLANKLGIGYELWELDILSLQKDEGFHNSQKLADYLYKNNYIEEASEENVIKALQNANTVYTLEQQKIINKYSPQAEEAKQILIELDLTEREAQFIIGNRNLNPEMEMGNKVIDSKYVADNVFNKDNKNISKNTITKTKKLLALNLSEVETFSDLVNSEDTFINTIPEYFLDGKHNNLLKEALMDRGLKAGVADFIITKFHAFKQRAKETSLTTEQSKKERYKNYIENDMTSLLYRNVDGISMLPDHILLAMSIAVESAVQDYKGRGETDKSQLARLFLGDQHATLTAEDLEVFSNYTNKYDGVVNLIGNNVSQLLGFYPNTQNVDSKDTVAKDAIKELNKKLRTTLGQHAIEIANIASSEVGDANKQPVLARNYKFIDHVAHKPKLLEVLQQFPSVLAVYDRYKEYYTSYYKSDVSSSEAEDYAKNAVYYGQLLKNIFNAWGSFDAEELIKNKKFNTQQKELIKYFPELQKFLEKIPVNAPTEKEVLKETRSLEDKIKDTRKRIADKKEARKDHINNIKELNRLIQNIYTLKNYFISPYTTLGQTGTVLEQVSVFPTTVDEEGNRLFVNDKDFHFKQSDGKPNDIISSIVKELKLQQSPNSFIAKEPPRGKPTYVSDRYAKLPKELEKKAIELQNTPWHKTVVADVAANIFNIASSLNKTNRGVLEKLQEALFELKPVNGVHKDIRKTNEASNKDKLRDWSIFMDNYKKGVFETPTYFSYGFMKNDRLLQQGLLSPQRSSIVRHLLRSHEPVTYNEDNLYLFKAAVVYNFKGDLSNFSKDEMSKYFNNLVNLKVDYTNKAGVKTQVSLMELAKEVSQLSNIDNENNTETINKLVEVLPHLKLGKESIVEGMHLLQGLVALGDYYDYHTGKADSFNSAVSVEIDGKTNGFAIGLMQFPLMDDETLELFLNYTRTFFLKGNKELVESAVKLGKKQDAYNHLGTIINDIYSKSKIVFQAYYFKKYQNEVSEQRLHLYDKANKALDYVFFNTPFYKLRDFAKNPLMIFLYGAGIFRITNALATKEIFMEGILPQIGDLQREYNAEQNKQEFINTRVIPFQNALQQLTWKYNAKHQRYEYSNINLVEAIKNNTALELSLPTELLIDNITNILSPRIDYSLTKMVGQDVMDSRNAVMEAVAIVAKDFVKKLQAKEKEFLDNLPKDAKMEQVPAAIRKSMVKEISEYLPQTVLPFMNDDEFLDLSEEYKTGIEDLFSTNNIKYRPKGSNKVRSKQSTNYINGFNTESRPAPLVGGIQNIDSYLLMAVMNKITQLVPLFDAIMTSPVLAEQGSELYGKAFIDMNMKYSLGLDLINRALKVMEESNQTKTDAYIEMLKQRDLLQDARNRLQKRIDDEGAVSLQMTFHTERGLAAKSPLNAVEELGNEIDVEASTLAPEALTSVKNDYTDASKTKITEDILSEELFINTLNTFKEGSETSFQNTRQFDQYQSKISPVVDAISSVLHNLGDTRVAFYTHDKETMGKYYAKKQQMEIYLGKNTRENVFGQSNQEVFLHETIHAVASVLDNMPLVKERVHKLFKNTLDAVSKQYGTEGYMLFLEGINNPDDNDIDLAKRMYETVFNSTEHNTKINEFFAYALSNPALMDFLSKQNYNQSTLQSFKDVKWNNLLNAFVDVLGILGQYLTRLGRNMRNKDAQVQAVVLFEHMTRIHNKNMNKYKRTTGINYKFNEILGKSDSKIRHIADKLTRKYSKRYGLLPVDVLTASLGIGRLVFTDSLAQKKAGDIIYKRMLKEPMNIVNEILDRSLTPEQVTVLGQNHHLFNKLTEEYKHLTHKIIADSFISTDYNKLSRDTKRALTDVVLKTDLQSIVDQVDITSGELINILDNVDAINVKKKAILSALTKTLGNQKYTNELVPYANELGQFIVTHKAKMYDSHLNVMSIFQKVFPKASDKAHKLLDAYVSLVALETLNKTRTRSITLAKELFQKEYTVNADVNGFTNMLLLHRNYIHEVKSGIFANNPNHVQKGYIRQTADTMTDLQFGDISEKESMRKKLYKMYDSHLNVMSIFQKVFPKASDKAHKLLDAYVSLVALENLNKTNSRSIKLAKELFQKEYTANADVNGFTNMLLLHRNYIHEIKNGIFANNPNHVQKGYIRQTADTMTDLQFGDITEKESMRKKLYKMYELPNVTGSRNPKVMYISKWQPQTNVVGGLLQATSLNQTGTLVSEILMNDKDYQDTDGNPDWTKINIKLASMIKEHLSLANKGIVSDDVHTVPLRDTNGDIIDLRVIMSYENKESRDILGVEREFHHVFGDMQASKIHKENALSQGMKAVDTLIQEQQEVLPLRPNAFVDILDKDSKYRDQYQLLPAELKKYIVDHATGGKFMIREEIVHKVLPYVAKDIKALKILNRPGFEYIRDVVVFAQYAIKTLVGAGTRTVIAKYPQVFIGNTISGIKTLSHNGVPVTYTLAKIKEGFDENRRYQKDRKEYSELKLKLDMLNVPVNDVRRKKLLELDSKIKNNNIHRLFEAGIQTMSPDELDISIERRGVFHRRSRDTKLEEVMNKTPRALKTITSELFMLEGSKGLALATEIVTLTDFLSRYAYIEYNTKVKGREFNVVKQEAIDLFVNFDMNMSPWMNYLNTMGIVWFLKYHLRNIAGMIKSLKMNPTLTLTAAVASATTGVNVLGNYAGTPLMGKWLPAIGKTGDIIELPFNIHLLEAFRQFGNPFSFLTR